MGGRGASSGVSVKGKKYGTEFSSIFKSGNIKFVKYNDSKSSKTPQETMTRGRVYVTVNKDNILKSITYFDNQNKRVKQIDLDHTHHDMNLHTHHGYNHNENDSKKKGASKLTPKEQKMVDRVNKLWYDFNNKR